MMSAAADNPPDPRTAIFRLRVCDCADAAPPTIPLDAACEQALAKINSSRAGAALLVNEARRIVGIITERDCARRIALKMRPREPAIKAMSAPVEVVGENDFLFEALAAMRRSRLRHLPVVAAGGRAVGMLRLERALSVCAARPLQEAEWFARLRTAADLRRAKAREVKLAADLLSQDLPAPEIQSLLTQINNGIARRAAELAMSDMRAAGLGDAPVGFAVLMMGSGGRGENFLHPDQDNGFILDDYPPEKHGDIDRWFVELASRFVAKMDAAGFPKCRGNVMATNPVWRKPLSEWREQTLRWTRGGGKFASRYCDIFFDFGWIYGQRDLVAKLRAHVTRIARRPSFLHQLYTDDVTEVALKLFNRIATDREDPAHRGEINLKHGAILPLVSSLRLLALRHGVPDTSTRARIDALVRAGALRPRLADDLQSAFVFVTGLLLRRQVADFLAGREVGNHIRADSLSPRERASLVAAMKSVQSLKHKLQVEFTGRVL